MKRILAVLLVIFLALPLASGVVFANEENEQTTPTTSEKETESNDLKERWEQRKKDFKVSLTFAEKTKLKARCKPAQTGQIKKIGGRINGIQTSRSKVHENILKHLNNLVPKLQEAGLDTSDLETQIETLKTKIETFNTDFATYKQAVADLQEIDCVAEPDGFKASLEAARAALDQVRTDAKDIRNYVKETIKKELVSLRSQLESDNSDSETEEE